MLSSWDKEPVPRSDAGTLSTTTVGSSIAYHLPKC
jgi:hypothetical protein